MDAKEPSLVPDLLDTLRAEFPGVPLAIYDSAASFASATMTMDMFSSGWRILVLWSLDEEGLKDLGQIVGFPTDDALLYVQRRSVPKSKAYTTLKAECEVLTLEPFDERSCVSYVAALFKKRGCECGPDVPEAVVSKVGADLPALKCEVKKLSLLCRRPTKADVDRVVRGRSDIRVFDFADAILRHRWMKACTMAAVAPEGDLIGLLHIIQMQCQKLYKAVMLKSQGMAPEDVASMLEVPAYVAKTRIIPLANQMGRQRILRMLDVVHAADERARLSRVPKRELMESLVIRLLRG